MNVQFLRSCGRPHYRSNWFFVGSESGGHRAAICYTLVNSCKQQRVDPHVYIKDVLKRVSTHPASRVEELTPARWKTAPG